MLSSSLVRWAGFATVLPGVTLSVAVAWLGFVLFTGEGTPAGQPSRAG